MPGNQKNKNLLRVIVLTFIGIVAFVVSVFMNVVGMRDAISKAPDSSGMAAISVRVNGTDSLGIKKSTKVDQEGKVVVEDFLVNALPIINLVNNNWDRVKAKFSGFQLDENGNAVFEKEGYTLYCNGTYVNCVVFNKNFEKELVGHLRVGDDFKTIESKLGEPTFRKSNCLGYKSREVYAFFYEDEVAIYPNRKISNQTIEDLFRDYQDKTFDEGRTRFLVEIRNYPDFTITQDAENNVVTITSLTRQVIAKLDGLGNIDVEFYNGYQIATDRTQELINEKIFIINDEDLVELTESERVRGK